MNKLIRILIMAVLFTNASSSNAMQLAPTTQPTQSAWTIAKKSVALGVVSWCTLKGLLTYSCTLDQPNGLEHCESASITINSFFMACLLALADAHARAKN